MKHETVLLKETIEQLAINPKGIYVDATLGGGGHSKAILNHLTTGFLYAFDQDQFAINQAQKVLNDYQNFEIIHANFKDLKQELHKRNITQIDGIIMDLGMSSFQIDDASRGFSYMQEASLDMRMNQTQALTAATIVNTYSKEALAHIFYVYGEEQNSFKIAQKIIEQRPLSTTSDLVKICDQVNYKTKGHSAKKVFQALRIAVNDELHVLETLLKDAVELLAPNGRIAAITFHSLEDRIVKQFFKEKSTVIVPKHLPLKDLPKGILNLVNHKPIYPSTEELEHNARSHSAKLRVASKNML